jgi:hypothetical protein
MTEGPPMANNIWEPDPQKRWERDTRQWWGWLVMASVLPLIPLLPVWEARFMGVLYGLLAVVIAFHAGFFYNDRLRQLGRERGFFPKLRRPPSHEPSADA